jgi:P4 family phage/plasmid primase-like protien
MHGVHGGACACHKGASCNRSGKHPASPHGVKDATTSRAQIKAWWSEGPDANIGIATGAVSGILVLDIDPRSGGGKTLRLLEKELGKLPKTVTALTGGGGKHLVFKYPTFPVKKDSNGALLGDGVDVLSDGAIMIAPPSRHLSGKSYRWQEGHSFADRDPASLPKRWLERLRSPKTSAVTDAPPLAPYSVVAEGSRNSYLMGLGGRLQHAGASANAIKAALLEQNAAVCSPPLDEGEVKRIAKSIAKYGPAAATGGQSDAAQTLLAAVLNQHFAGGKHLSFGVDGQFWSYDGKLWRSVSDQWIAGRIFETLQASAVRTGQNTSSLLGQVSNLMKAKLAVKDDQFSFTTEPPPVINCSNGELWISPDGSVELKSHRPESRLRHCLDVEYDPDAQCPEYDRAVLGIFGAAEKPKRMVRHWNELLGYLIQPKRNIPLIIILLGGGDNGKTVLARTAVKQLGQDLVQAQRIEDLDKSRFAMGNLFGKHVFLDDDVRAGARLPDGMLKTISEAKTVSGELKFKPTFNFIVRAVPVLLCNNIPSIADLSHGMRRRLMVIPFDRTFTDKDRDSGLFERIWANELPGVLNRALAGYRRVLKRGSKFKRPFAVDVATKRLLRQANPLPAFIEENCVTNSTARCLLRAFYDEFHRWTREQGFTLTQNQMTVRRNLENLGFAVKHGNTGETIHGLKLIEHNQAQAI